MGYTTDFPGCFKCTPALSEARRLYLTAFAEERHMRRYDRKNKYADEVFTVPYRVQDLPDPLRKAVGLPVGKQGAYFVGGSGFAGQARDVSVVDPDTPPSGCPSLWCHWVPSKCGKYIGWNGDEKFTKYVDWLIFITDHFLGHWWSSAWTWGVTLNGVVRWQGEDPNDWGSIVIRDNNIYRCERVPYTPTYPGKMAQPSTRNVLSTRPIRSIRELKRRG